jgi:hypothetical protein
MHLRCIGKLLLDRRRGLCLHELPEPRPGIRESPGRQFNPKRIQSPADPVLMRTQRPFSRLK